MTLERREKDENQETEITVPSLGNFTGLEKGKEEVGELSTPPPLFYSSHIRSRKGYRCQLRAMELKLLVDTGGKSER